MKRPVCWALLLLLFLPALTCKNFAPDGHDDPNRVIYTDVIYSPDGKFVTIYIDGTTVPVKNGQSRALSRPLAIAGHDYFEVAFIGNSGGSEVVARAAWELRKDAHVEGVARGVNYNTVNPKDLGNDFGAAILFVGKKTDKTLLGVGKLSGTDDGGTAATTITANTRSVTFAVDALESGVVGAKYGNLAGSSFLTSFNAGTPSSGAISAINTESPGLVRDYQIDKKGYPLFKLRENNITYAHYEFFTASGSNLNTAYSPGIILAGAGSYGKKQPRNPDGSFQWNAALRLDDRTKITPVNNLTAAGESFQNPVIVEFDTRADAIRETTISGSVFGFVFEVPVYPLSNLAAASGMSPGTWYIRASYDSYWLNLDDGGMNATGGAVLVGTGDTPNYSEIKIVLINPPVKYKYSYDEGFVFDIEGLEVEMRTDDKPGSFIRTLTYGELDFFIGSFQINPKWTTQPKPPGSPAPGGPGTSLSEELFGLQVVRIRYLDPYTGKEYWATFPIICGGGNPARDFTNINPANTAFIRAGTDSANVGTIIENLFGGIMADPPGGIATNDKPSGVFVIVFENSIDFTWAPNIYRPNDLGSFLIIVMAGGDRVILGRGGGGGVVSPFMQEFYGGNAYYFCTWPFSEGITVNNYYDITPSGTTTILNNENTYPFVINANGSITQTTVTDWTERPPIATGNVTPDPPAPSPPPATTYYNMFIRNAWGGRIHDVSYDESAVKVLNELWLH